MLQTIFYRFFLTLHYKYTKILVLPYIKEEIYLVSLKHLVYIE